MYIAWCTLFLAVFGGNLCESIALTVPPSFPPSLPSFIFFIVDSSSSSNSEKESLGENVDEEEEDDKEEEVGEEEEEEMGSDLDGLAPTPIGVG